MKNALREFTVIVIGVLVALFVDGVREERQERRILEDALGDVAAEIEANDYTLRRMRDVAIPEKVQALEEVLAVLRSDASVTDTLAFFRSFAASALTIRPWIIDDRYQALRSSGQLRLVRDSGIAARLADFHRGPDILFGMADGMRGNYRLVVEEIVPVELAVELNPIGFYAPNTDVPQPPTIRGTPDYGRAMREVRRRSYELQALASTEVAYAAGWAHALNRYVDDAADLLMVLAPWHREAR